MRHPVQGCAFVIAFVAVACVGASPAIGAEKGSQGQIDALVLGEAQSRVLEELNDAVKLDETKASDAEHVAPRRFDMVILDGDQRSRDDLADNALLERYTDAGDPVMALDVSDGERRVLQRYTGFSASSRAEEHSEMFMFDVSMSSGTPTTQIIDSGPLTPLGARAGSERNNDLRSSYARRTAQDAVDILKHKPLSPSADRPPVRSRAGLDTACTVGACASDVQHWHIEYKPPSQMRNLGNGKFTGEGRHCYATINCPNPGSQTAIWTLVHNFDVYLINKDDPDGDKQVIEWSLDGQFSPKLAGGDFFLMDKKFTPHPQWLSPPGTHEFLERAWWTGYAGLDVEPPTSSLSRGGVTYPETDSRLTWKKSSPATVNSETSYTVGGDSLNLGITLARPDGGGGASGSYTIQFPSETKQIPKWGMENLTGGNHVKWFFSSRDSCDVRPGYYLGATTGRSSDPRRCWEGNDANTPRLPNELSRGQLPLSALAVWETNTLVTQSDPDFSFLIDTPITVVDTYCDDYRMVCFGGGTLRTQSGGPDSFLAKFSPANVIPVGIKSLSVPAAANGAQKETVKGTITLDRPPPLPVNVVIYSASPNASVGPPYALGSRTTVTIKKGETVGTFDVATNANGIAQGETRTATITAVYGDPVTKQMDIAGPR